MPEPSLTRDEVARTLRELRAASGLTVTEAAAAAGIAQSTLTRYEKGRFLPPRKAIEALIKAYKPDRATRGRLLGATREQQPRYKRVVMHRGAAAAQVQIGDLERHAVRQLTFTPTIVPGLLQSERYMRALAGAGLSGDKLEEWVRNRVARQGVLTEPGHDITQVITFGALLWGAGSAEVMRDQLDRLAELSRLRSVEVGIVPPARPTGVFPLHGFDFYELPGGSRRVIVGTHGGVVTIDDQRGVDEYLALWQQLRDAAVFGDEARALLTEISDRWYLGGAG
ncbi:MAG: helix-turn-helix domain-containing protein [Pseudonocardia sp.]|nr:helix-turn-helix domain-containing protein [Pseudonocardia sp.]